MLMLFKRDIYEIFDNHQNNMLFIENDISSYITCRITFMKLEKVLIFVK